jgi:hypothetical protein
VVDLELFGQIFYSLIDEVCPLITHQCSWNPNYITMFSNKKCRIDSALHSITGVTSAHRFRYYVVVVMHLSHDILVGGFIGPMKSISYL